VRFEPGDTKTVTLVAIAGNRVIRGGNNLADGPVSDEGKAAAIANAANLGFANEGGA
jgi:urease subunit gamma/beta